MWSNIIFVVASLCVVNASVITVNVFDDDTDRVEPQSAEACNWQACDQLCRRLGFPSGVCINGRCKCDNFKNAEDEVETVEPQTAEACNWQACDQLCRRLGFPSGVCVNGRCKCDNFKHTEDQFVSVVQEGAEDCNWQACDQLCRRLGFPSGVCVNGRCKCDNFRSTEGFDSLIEQYSAARSCNPQECNQRCRRLKFPGGACVNGRCKCDNFRNANDMYAEEITKFNLLLNEDENLEDSPSSPVREELTRSSCNPQECNQRCRRLKFPGGACVNGRCKCDNFRNADVLNSDVGESMSPRSCDPVSCQQRCRRIGFRGACVNGSCRCFSRSAQATVSHIVEPVVEASDYSRVRYCDLKVCNTICRLLRYKSGTCVNGKCQCSSTEDVTSSTTQKPATVRMEEPNPVGNTANNEIEQSNLILNKEENHEDIVGDAERYKREVCNMWLCNQRCRTMGFRGGMCLDNVCKCNNLP